MSFMNRKFCLLLFFVFLGIFGTITNVSGQSIPPWVRDAWETTEDVLVGVGSAKLNNSQNSMNFAEFNAKMGIARQIVDTIAIPDRFWNENDAGAVTLELEFVAQELTFEFGNELRIVRRSTESDGTSWCVVSLNRAGIEKYHDMGVNFIQTMF